MTESPEAHQGPQRPCDLRKTLSAISGQAVINATPDSWSGNPVLFSICSSWHKHKSKITLISGRKEEKQCLLKVCLEPVTFTHHHLCLTLGNSLLVRKSLLKVTHPVLSTRPGCSVRCNWFSRKTVSDTADSAVKAMAYTLPLMTDEN